MAAVSPCNVVIFILARTDRSCLAEAERHFIRKLHPVFNSKDVQDSPWTVICRAEPLLSDDFVTTANRVLRKEYLRCNGLR